MFSHIGSVGPFEILVLLSGLMLPPSFLAPKADLEVTDVEGWTKNPLFGVLGFVVEVAS